MVQRVTRKGKERKVIYLIRTYIHNARIRAKIEDSFGKKKKKSGRRPYFGKNTGVTSSKSLPS
jgi:hypothetical protein